MNEQNRFNEYLEKMQHYWELFITACYVWMQKAGTWIMDHGKQLLQLLAILLLKARDLVERFINWVKAQADKGKAWLESRKQPKQEALPVAEEVKALPEEAAAEPEATEAVGEPEVQVAVVTEAAAAEEAAAEAAEEQPAAQTAVPVGEVPAEKTNLQKVGGFLAVIGRGVKLVIKWIWQLRKVIMAAPVIWAAVKLAMENMDRLPESVGLDIQSTGEFARMITRQEAVYWPLGITLFCLLLMFLSKKPLLPWVISIFTLVLPWLIWILNYYA